jgi:hypothetical protein
LRDYDNKTIELKNNNLSLSWIGPSGCEVMLPLILDVNENVTDCKIKHKSTSGFYGGILQCSTQ